MDDACGLPWIGRHHSAIVVVPGGNGISGHGGETLNCRNILKREVEGTPAFLNITVSKAY